MDFQFLYSHIFCFNLAEGTSTIVILEGLGQGKIPRAIQQDLLQVQDGQHTFLVFAEASVFRYQKLRRFLVQIPFKLLRRHSGF